MNTTVMNTVRTDTRPSRQEDHRLITGQGRYTADWNLPGQLHAHMLRSDRAHARIVSIDTSAARNAPGVATIYTHEDVTRAGFKGIPAGAPLKGHDGAAHVKCVMPVLAQDAVRFVGQPIAMVIAQSARAAQDAAELIEIRYEELPVAVTMEAALAPDAPVIHPAIGSNLSLVYEEGDARAVAQAFDAAAHVTTLRLVSQRLIGAPMELRATLASYDAARNRYTVYTPTQGMQGMRASLAFITGWPLADIEVIAQDVGGSFGLRGATFSEHPLLMLAARELGRPVKWCASRSELFVGEWHGRALVLEGSLALDREGNMLAIRFEDQADLGAYTCYWQSFIGTKNISVTMGGVYKIPALAMRSRLVFTNTVPVSAYRGAGRPDIAFAIERLVDQAAREHGFDPIALRRRNFIGRNDFPYRTANGTVYDCGDFEGTMDKALALAGHATFETRRKAAATKGLLRGIGVACYLEASGGGGAPKDTVTCQFAADGSIMLFGVTGPSGQGHETSFTQIVAQGLGLPTDRLRYRASDPTQDLVGNGTGGSRSLYGAGSAFKALATNIIERARPYAAQVLGADAASLVYGEGAFRAPDGAASITLTALARQLAGPTPHPLDCAGDAVSGMTFPNGCHVAEIEIDPETGVTEVIAYTAVDDLGNIISPQLVAGQVHGGVVQGAGQVFGEHAIYDEESGQLLTGSFMDYPMPRAGCVPVLRTDENPVPTALNALGAKGVGESGCSGSLPALTAAMMDALRREGVPPMDMPFTPARVWEAIRAARSRR